MTIPSTISLPIHGQGIQGSEQELQAYVSELVFSLENMYESLAQAINGDIFTQDGIGSEQFQPTISGQTAEGVGTYTHQVGWVLRKGLITDVWFDIEWSAHTGTGNLVIDLPYLVAISDEKPFMGMAQASNITYAGDYLVLNAQPGTRQLELWEVTAAAPTAQVAIDTAGQLIGYVRYVGQELERD